MIKVCILHKGTFTQYEFEQIYLKRAIEEGIDLTNCLIDTEQVYFPKTVKKVPAADRQVWLNDNSVLLDRYDYILVSEPEYFKTISGQSKAETNIGLVYPSKFGSAQVLYLPSIQSYNYDKLKQEPNIRRTFQTLNKLINSAYVELGSDIIHFEEYPDTLDEIETWLEKLHEYPALTCDIEAKSLKVTEAGIYTIGFAWDEHSGICFPVDAVETYSRQIRALLLKFFSEYKGKLIVHKANYDIPVINYTLFQNEDITDIANQIKGLNTLCEHLDDTLLITYLATNNTGGNTLGLKELAQPFAGNWAVDVTDVTKVPLSDLMRYNLIDCLSTWYVYKTYYPIMVQEEQETLYKQYYLPYLKDNMRCQLNGLPIDLDAVSELKDKLVEEQTDLLTKLCAAPSVAEAEYLLTERRTITRNSKLKVKVTTLEDNYEPFNFNSKAQLATLLYECLGLPVIEYTDSKQPSTSKKTLAKLINHTDKQEVKDLIQQLIELADIEKILTAFIPAFETAHIDKYGNAHLTGYLNLCGTVSGRLSSNNP